MLEMMFRTLGRLSLGESAVVVPVVDFDIWDPRCSIRSMRPDDRTIDEGDYLEAAHIQDPLDIGRRGDDELFIFLQGSFKD